ncbi:redox-sensitive transcriptional activator SoxR [Thalassotalea fusca]
MSTGNGRLEDANLKVGDVAKRCGIKVSTLHFYEEKGLIRSWRNNGNQRRYKREVLRRISVIKAAQKMGITLEEIKQAFSTLPDQRTPSTQDWEMLANRWQASLDRKIAQMTALRNSLSTCIGCGCLSLKKCPIYNEDDYLASEGDGPVILWRKANAE